MFAEIVDRVGALDDAALTSRLREIELEQRRLEAELAAVVAEAERRRLHEAEANRTVRTWLRAHTNWSGAQATQRIRLGRLVADLPAVGESLAAGHVGVAQVHELARARANPRCGDQLGSVIDVLLDHCEHLGYDDARTCVRRWETLADLDGAHRDRAVSVEARTALVGPLGAGVVVSASGGSAVEAAEMAAVFESYVEAELRRDVADRDARSGLEVSGAGLPRTGAQRSFDALLAIFRAAGQHGAEGATRPVPTVVNLIGDVSTFESALAAHGLVDPTASGVASDLTERRCETAAGVPLLPDDLVRHALTGHVRRVVVDSAGVVVDWGRKRRLFTGPAREAATLLVRRCQRPGCGVAAGQAEVDHRRAWADHGPTDQDNAGVLCRFDNRAKHRLALTVRRTADGYLNWRDRDGRPLAPVGRRLLPDEADIERAIRRRVAALVEERERRDRSRRPV